MKRTLRLNYTLHEPHSHKKLWTLKKNLSYGPYIGSVPLSEINCWMASHLFKLGNF